MKIIELFAGVGGFRLGFGEHHEYVYVNDMNADANLIYKKQFAHDCDNRKIETVPANEIPDHDLLCGGFPCATFSIAGSRVGLSNTHDKGLLFYEIIRIISTKNPKYVLLENVEGLLTHENGRTFGVVLYELGRLGYSIQWQKFDSVYFGTPQHRERVFILGIRGERYQIFPIFPTSRTYFKGRVVQFRRGKVRTFAKGTFPCLTASMGTGGNNVPFLVGDNQLRKLTHEECELLQGLPIGHTEGLASASRYERIGRSLNPRIAQTIMRKIEEYERI